jgi:hypothetical protein
MEGVMMADEKPNKGVDLLLDEPSYEKLHDVLFKGKQKPKFEKLPLVSWDTITVPANATDLERLTYVPGLVGDTTEWIVRGARRPNRVIALGVSVVTCGTIMGRFVRGPTESDTSLYLIMLAPTGFGKDWPYQAGDRLLDGLGKVHLIGPGEWASAPGFAKALIKTPLMVCFMDELGDEISLVNAQGQNRYVSKIVGLLKKCYGAWGVVSTAEKVDDEKERIVWPHVSIIGIATPESFFTALSSRDLESGFANRMLILPFTGMVRAPEQSPPLGAKDPPRDLLERLKLLPQPPDTILAQTPDGRLASLHDIPWGAGAEKYYLAFSREMDKYQSDRRRFELSIRTCENAVRWATIVAVGRGSPTVDLPDITHAISLSRLSFEAAVGGIERYMQEYLEFPRYCDRVLDAIKAEGFISDYQLHRRFGRHQRHGFELDRVLKQLTRQGYINHCNRSPRTGGNASPGWAYLDVEADQ